MAGIIFNCPRCKQSLEASRELLGTTIDCPICRATINVSSPRRAKKLVIPGRRGTLMPSRGRQLPGSRVATMIALLALVLLVAAGVHFIRCQSLTRTFPFLPTAAPTLGTPDHERHTEDGVSGTWHLHRGKAIDTLNIRDTQGVLRGTLTKDMAWGGTSWPVQGMRVGNEVTIFYTTCETNDSTCVTADFSLTGTIEGQKISGTYNLNMMSTAIATGETTARSGRDLWIARRHRVDATER